VIDAAEWDDLMPMPVIEHSRYAILGTMLAGNLVRIPTTQLFYAYNYNVLTANIRFRTLRNFFPLVNAGIFYFAYRYTAAQRSTYKTQIAKINLFDEYCWLRAQELVKQNEYLLKHEGRLWLTVDVKRFLWWNNDLKDTLAKVHRQANDHEASDFKDSELLLQDFINRYSNPESDNPMENALYVGV